MRALAHPARIEIVEYLNTTGEALTATECARLVGLSPSATSYHLRELAKYGLVEQAPGRGDGRERLWRTVSQHVRIAGDDQEPETHAAERALVDLYLDRDMRRLEYWMDHREELEPEWREVGTILGASLLVTPAELEKIAEAVRVVVEPYQTRIRRADPPDGAREVRADFLAFPAMKDATNLD